MANRIILEFDHLSYGLLRAVAIYNTGQIEAIVFERREQDSLGAVRWDETLRLSWKQPVEDNRAKLYLYAILEHLAQAAKPEGAK